MATSSSQTGQNSLFQAFYNRIWNRIVTPHPSLTGIDKQQVRLLLSLIAASLPWMLALGVVDVVFQSSGYLSSYLVFDITLPSLVLLAYVIARTRYFRIGAWIVVLAPALVVSTIVILFSPDEVGAFSLYYLVFCPLLSSLLLNVRATLFVTLLNLGIILAGMSRIPYWTLGRTSDEILFNILVPILLAVSTVVRQRYIEQLKHAEFEARIAKEEAEHSNNVKSIFLATMSHELRTPLNIILNYTEMLTMPVFGEVNNNQQEALKIVHSSGTHLLGLINDVLDIARIEADGMQLVIEREVNLYKEMEPVIASAQTLLKDKPIQFFTDIDINLPLIACDRRRIKQVFFNLISNAAKFTEAGSITFSIKSRLGHILFMVSDTGPGISPEEQLIIFEPFKQSEAGLKHGGGTGLGLPISRSIIDAHGGKLWVESEKGDGSSFFVSLPVEPQLLLRSAQNQTVTSK